MHLDTRSRRATSLWLTLIALATLQGEAQTRTSKARVAAIVQKIQHADYAGDRTALERHAKALAPFIDETRFGSRVLYWRGFALWRRSMNSSGPSAAGDMEADLLHAASDFREAARIDPAFVEARATEAFCMVNVSALNIGTDRARALFRPAMDRFNEALSRAPDNPRILWMHGANQFYQPRELGGGEDLALATYQRGLAVAEHEPRPVDPLEPSWGEPELLMSLAFASLHQSHPDVPAARRYAERALERVPYWHYVRDVLMAQIRAAEARRPQFEDGHPRPLAAVGRPGVLQGIVRRPSRHTPRSGTHPGF